jgi:hypothetical protein
MRALGERHLGEFAAVERGDLVAHCDAIAFKAPHSGG